MAQQPYDEQGEHSTGWSEAANLASQNLFNRLERQHGHGKVKFMSIEMVKLTAVPAPNPGSIQTFQTTIRVVADHP
jgi:hypothetical protein